MKKDMKIMPYSLEAEQAVLGCLLIDNEVSINIMGKLKQDDFYTDTHKKIFEAMTGIYNARMPIDFVTTVDALEKGNSLEAVGGIDYITTLTNAVPSSANYKHYMEIVKRDSILRKLIHGSSSIIEIAYETKDNKIALEYAEKKIFDIAEKESTSSLEHVADSLNEVIEKFDKIAKDPNSIHGIPSGFKDLDNVTRGFHNSDLILLAARPGVGKTSLAMNFVTHMAVSEGKKVAVFSLEMPKAQLMQRALCSVAKVNMGKPLKGKMEMDEWKSIWAANKKLAAASIYIDDSSMTTPMDILSKCRRLKRQDGLDFVLIDYLQLMSSGNRKTENRQQEVSEITRTLKIAAKELGVPILVLSQLSRAVEQRQEHRPQLSDLRESGSIEQDADIVMFIYNPEQYNDVVSQDEPGVCELIIAKHRNGSQGTIKLRWIGEYTTFTDISAPVARPKKIDIEAPPEEATEEPFDGGDIDGIFN